jgi:hypothetical protein
MDLQFHGGTEAFFPTQFQLLHKGKKEIRNSSDSLFKENSELGKRGGRMPLSICDCSQREGYTGGILSLFSQEKTFQEDSYALSRNKEIPWGIFTSISG